MIRELHRTNLEQRALSAVRLVQIAVESQIRFVHEKLGSTNRALQARHPSARSSERTSPMLADPSYSVSGCVLYS